MIPCRSKFRNLCQLLTEKDNPDIRYLRKIEVAVKSGGYSALNGSRFPASAPKACINNSIRVISRDLYHVIGIQT